ncbi:hypothetical protein BDN70DRAFT_412046 [Pholiota conissans]|uniref:DH domain-containing protein n=1 Tax=Pholiota conissans TaxID=109636 RepID=A0A9P5YSW6_9AGAR|nr:hypothetical protein BDN70DRAFT_412046 [Pholiota conissans]
MVPEGKNKKANPLTDLVETEKTFVDQLTGIIRKVAAAWSRSNLPPPELDTMFRSIEGVYKANRGLHAKLKDINADPKSAGELGGLLIKWIDDLKKPYETYCTKYSSGFDTWEPVQSNTRLGPILVQFSVTNPPPNNADVWTLDSLFLLPKLRLKYYRKLYNRLLKNTDNRLLVGAVETINDLMDTLESRSLIKVGDQKSETFAAAGLQPEDEIVIDMQNQKSSPPMPTPKALRLAENDAKTDSETSSNHGSISAGERLSRESEATSLSRASTQTLAMPISDLERRLATDRTLDIFTMTPKAVKLQMSPPSLTFTRELRTSVDVVIRFTPRATGVEVVHQRGHIFLLSDLFLVCERIPLQEQEATGKDGPDMRLCYPPLAGKVLRVSDVNGQDALDNSLQVAIMRKEFLVLEADTREGRNVLMSHFKECIEFSGSLPPPSKQPPPPMPSLNGIPRLQTDNASTNPPYNSSMTAPSTAEERGSGNMSPLGQRPLSPAFPGRHDEPGSSSEIPPPAYHTTDGRPIPSEKGRSMLPPGASGLPSVPFLRPSASAQPFQRGPSFGPNNTLPPTRSTGHLPGSGFDSPAGPSVVPPNPQYSAPPLNGNNSPIYPLTSNPRPMNQFPSGPSGGLPQGPSGAGFFPPSRPPSDLSMGSAIRKSPSIHSLGSQYSHQDLPGNAPPLPSFPPGHPNVMHHANGINGALRNNSNNSFAGGLQVPQPRPLLPSAQARAISMAEIPITEPSPPNSPQQQAQDFGPVVSTISAQMKCKVFLQQHHAQWKSLGSAKLKLYRQEPTNVKQLVVEADNKDKSVLISTIVLTDGVERVGKTGVAIELSDKGARTGIVYMIQLRNETSAGGLFDSLLAGSDRATRG